jgi:uncharacterized damage-inducible protein DinB
VVETETDLLLSSLNNQRAHVLGILEGLSDDALRRPILPSGWTCLGMIQHLTVADERFWFRGIVAGDPACVNMSEEADAAAWHVSSATSAAAVFDAYRHEIELANAVITTTALDTAPALWPHEFWPTWRLQDLRAVLLHVITETACHAGHLDAARELIDGRKWLG